MLLEVRGLTKYFGGLASVNDLDFHVKRGETLGIIGPNGAGKTTVFNLISGALPPSRGRILFKGENITGCNASVTARKGIARTFQLANLFNDKTVLENMSMAFYLESKFKLRSAVFNTSSLRERERNISRKSHELIEFVGLGGMADKPVKALPHGHRKCLAFAMALAASPELLLLDEPVAGMNTAETAHMIDLIRVVLNETGVTILLVEHNLRVIMDLCKRILVLNFGTKIAEGSPDEIREDQRVIEAYLGVDFHAA
jgi:branched-chain amino acid transport system ATP-binding protein